MKFIITFFIFLYSFQPAFAQGDTISFTPQNEQAVRDLIKRVLPKHADYFIIRLIPKKEVNDTQKLALTGKSLAKSNRCLRDFPGIQAYPV